MKEAINLAEALSRMEAAQNELTSQILALRTLANAFQHAACNAEGSSGDLADLYWPDLMDMLCEKIPSYEEFSAASSLVSAEVRRMIGSEKKRLFADLGRGDGGEVTSENSDGADARRNCQELASAS